MGKSFRYRVGWVKERNPTPSSLGEGTKDEGQPSRLGEGTKPNTNSKQLPEIDLSYH